MPESPVLTPPTVAAIVLAGGRSSRFGADKLRVEIDGRPLLAGVLAAASGVASDVVVVGEVAGPLAPGVRVTREEPAYAGPFAAVAAGMALVDADIVLVLAGDLVGPAPAIGPLLDALATHPHADAAVVVDAEGRRQPLLAAFRVVALRGCIAGVDTFGRAAGALLDGLHIAEVGDPDSWARDIDTLADLDG